MLKKIMAVIFATVCLVSVNGANKAPIFKDYANQFEVYIGDASSSAQITRVTKSEFYFLDGVCGESFKTDKDGFELDRFLSEFSAKIVFTERIAEGTSYYAYSPKIKYRKTVKGKTINLHVFIGKEVSVGAPLILGSF
ncbi:MAG: hypothetical protein IJX03_06570 [Clostridia bacterium]|nr:hypothetical protein [Clostridia bacterium]